MVTRLFLAPAALLLSALLPAQVLANDLEGHWALRIDDATIFVFTLDLTEEGRWEGAWTRPTEIDSNGVVFRRMDGSETVRPIESGQRGDVVQLVFAGPQGSNQRDVLRFTPVAENQATLTYLGLPGDPYPLVRVRPDTPLGPFDDMRIYDRDNAVLEADFEAADDPEAMAGAELVAAEDGADMPAAAPEGEPEAGAVWEPLGLVDEDTAAAAAEEAGLELEPLAEAGPPAEDAAGDGEEAEEDDPEERPRITADFLDGL